MDGSSSLTKKLEWKWVVITFFLYVVFYLVPILTALGTFWPHDFGHIADVFLGIWVFGGIIVIAAVAAFISKGITIWEPAIAGGVLVGAIFGYAAIRIFYATVGIRFSMFRVLLPMLFIVMVVFVLSLLGASLGERAQKLWRSEKSE
jgi:hypothetical protein